MFCWRLKIFYQPALREAQARRAYVILLFKKYLLVIFFRPIISTSTGPIFTKFAGLVELWRV